MIERLCPICGAIANSPHHVKPRSLGGSDNARNIVYLCCQCHDYIEEIQEQQGVELSPELISKMRQELAIKLGADSDGISESYTFRDGKHFLLWVILPDETKKWICQYIDGTPDEAKTSSTIKVATPIPQKRKRGRPLRDKISTSYLEELAYNKGMSLRAISSQLESEGFHLSFSVIRKRLIKADNYIPLLRAECKQCGKLFVPKGNRRIYCSPECYAIHERCIKRLIKVETNSIPEPES